MSTLFLHKTITSLIGLVNTLLSPDHGVSLTGGKSHYEQELPETPLLVAGNAASLLRLFLILIDNAVKYTPREGRISVVLDVSNGTAVTEIRDTGVGISSSDLHHIFQRFYRADASRSRDSGGTGLGLSIAKWIAEAHQGKIRVVSKLGEGSVFRVRLPCSRIVIEGNA